MPATQLEGPFVLSTDRLTALVTRRSPGAYALGEVKRDGTFVVWRIGRSDFDLKLRLHTYVGQYPAFKAGYFPTAAAAFQKECALFHDFSPPHNKLHPDRPDGSKLTCPFCPTLD